MVENAYVCQLASDGFGWEESASVGVSESRSHTHGPNGPNGPCGSESGARCESHQSLSAQLQVLIYLGARPSVGVSHLSAEDELFI
ncbi:hypothetical protein I7I50_00849 [Histoplasma capsulatum G186AR]|uniref:Uncharacterized protein n=1 Tax=Ajellomyces capsulatus TaxID=5037 RepID=A0A8H8CUE9_AJECA|nr:hypothetical protein I7I52_08117 [Histoplasma capsulatum]QSS72868.1 hypothetical protein I7I50_00849 [Histoplasma capsulatum G186AR]